jgi:hypothetical protein
VLRSSVIRWSRGPETSGRQGEWKTNSRVHRRVAAWACSIVVGVTASFVGGAPAFASDTEVNVSYSHAHGALAVKATAHITWLNRSVALGSPHTYCIAEHECQVNFYGYDNGLHLLDTYVYYMNTVGEQSTDYYHASFTLDGSCCVGGIRRIIVIATDITHNANGLASYYR